MKEGFLRCHDCGAVTHKNAKTLETGAYQMEPPSPIQALGVNPVPSRFIIRTVPRGDGGKSQSQRLNDTATVFHETAGNPVLTGQTKS